MRATYHEKLALTAQARHAALHRLVAAHDAEFQKLLFEEREARGLPPRTATGEVEYLRRRVAELEGTA